MAVARSCIPTHVDILCLGLGQKPAKLKSALLLYMVVLGQNIIEHQLPITKFSMFMDLNKLTEEIFVCNRVHLLAIGNQPNWSL